MGVEHGLFCHKCKKWVDGHKNWGLYFAVHEHWCDRAKNYVTRPPTWDELKEEKSPTFDLYWTYRMFAFLWKHKEHGGEVEWLNDGGDDQDRYFELYKAYGEEFRDDEKEPAAPTVQATQDDS